MKTIATAAALAAWSGAACAQSSVTTFVLLDLNLTLYSSGSVAKAGTVRSMNDGTTNGLNGSRFGPRGRKTSAVGCGPDSTSSRA